MTFVASCPSLPYNRFTIRCCIRYEVYKTLNKPEIKSSIVFPVLLLDPTYQKEIDFDEVMCFIGERKTVASLFLFSSCLLPPIFLFSSRFFVCLILLTFVFLFFMIFLPLSSSFAISTSAFFSFPCLFHCPDPHTCAFKVREVKVLMSVVRVTYSLKCPDTRSCGRGSWGINRSVMIVLEWGGGEMCGRLINTGSHTHTWGIGI